ncbi:hypothetical protein M758_11G025000 [Ceratodon purpureus]|nr:hypothetical protein M758_11G025000 [Ceratodon purpureus]
MFWSLVLGVSGSGPSASPSSAVLAVMIVCLFVCCSEATTLERHSYPRGHALLAGPPWSRPSHLIMTMGM